MQKLSKLIVNRQSRRLKLERFKKINRVTLTTNGRHALSKWQRVRSLECKQKEKNRKNQKNESEFRFCAEIIYVRVQSVQCNVEKREIHCHFRQDFVKSIYRIIHGIIFVK